eukprot:CAMPEP_0194347036 /NCGR_PEP_ID=MMETSP0171-20130528/105761_1 /TAXON_ID=218684 /ORGANISM="Corethron pennatum, Strain L29A3" /LENGTH=745 /DNA_ID=CAMNT_0039114239 /DNA_START=59 /DNA_END=2296 /DNA_ORIENTATION=-
MSTSQEYNVKASAEVKSAIKSLPPAQRVAVQTYIARLKEIIVDLEVRVAPPPVVDTGHDHGHGPCTLDHGHQEEDHGHHKEDHGHHKEDHGHHKEGHSHQEGEKAEPAACGHDHDHTGHDHGHGHGKGHHEKQTEKSSHDHGHGHDHASKHKTDADPNVAPFGGNWDSEVGVDATATAGALPEDATMSKDDESTFPPLYAESAGEDYEKASDAKMAAGGFKSDGDWEKALSSYTEAVLAAPPSALLYANRADSLLRLERPSAAIRDCDAALSHNPDSAKAMRVRGKAHRALGNWDRALSDLSGSQAIDYDDSGATEENLKFVKAKVAEATAEKTKKRNESEEKLRKRAAEIKKAQEEAAKEEAERAQESAMPEMPGMPGMGGGMPGMPGMGGGMPGMGGGMPGMGGGMPGMGGGMPGMGGGMPGMGGGMPGMGGGMPGMGGGMPGMGGGMPGMGGGMPGMGGGMPGMGGGMPGMGGGMPGMPGMGGGGAGAGGGMGGMGGAMGGIMSLLMSDPELAAGLQNPKVLAAFSELMKSPGGAAGLMSNPTKVQELLADPEVGPFMQKLMTKLGPMMGGMGGMPGMGGGMPGMGGGMPGMGGGMPGMGGGMPGMPGMGGGGAGAGGGMGGMGGAMGGIMSLLMSDPELAAGLQNPKVLAAFSELMKSPGGAAGLMSNPTKVQELLADPEVGPFMQKLMTKLGPMMGGMGGMPGMGGGMPGMGGGMPNAPSSTGGASNDMSGFDEEVPDVD